MPTRTASPPMRSTRAAAWQARRSRATSSGVLTSRPRPGAGRRRRSRGAGWPAGPARRGRDPARPERPAGAGRAAGRGGARASSDSRWHFLYFWPLPHQQGSLRPGRAARVAASVMASDLRRDGAAEARRPGAPAPGSARAPAPRRPRSAGSSSASTPPAVSAPPTPVPCTSSGRSAWRSVVKATKASTPVSRAAGWSSVDRRRARPPTSARPSPVGHDGGQVAQHLAPRARSRSTSAASAASWRRSEATSSTGSSSARPARRASTRTSASSSVEPGLAGQDERLARRVEAGEIVAGVGLGVAQPDRPAGRHRERHALLQLGAEVAERAGERPLDAHHPVAGLHQLAQGVDDRQAGAHRGVVGEVAVVLPARLAQRPEPAPRHGQRQLVGADHVDAAPEGLLVDLLHPRRRRSGRPAPGAAGRPAGRGGPGPRAGVDRPGLGRRGQPLAPARPGRRRPRRSRWPRRSARPATRSTTS